MNQITRETLASDMGNWKKSLGVTLLLVVAIALTIALANGLTGLSNWALSNLPGYNNSIVNQVIAPDIEIPKEENTNIPYLQKQISGAYEVVGNPYSNYEANAFKVALRGNFKDALIEVKGKITDNEEKFVSFNVGSQSGVLNGVRKSESSLDYEQTKARGGVFSDVIEFKVDLLAPTILATSKEEFFATRQATKSVLLWDYIQPPPPTVFSMLLAPYSANGSYGNVKIEFINFKYQCQDGSQCDVAVCDKPNLRDKGSACIQEKFDSPVDAKKYIDQLKARGIIE